MIKKMIFGGCSYTWGQSLHYYGRFIDDVHPKDGFFYGDKLLPHHYQYNVDNRFATIVADRFERKPIAIASNGGSNDQICIWIKMVIEENPLDVDCVIFQTTSFARGYSNGYDEQEQIKMILDLIKYCEDKNILIRFVHWDWEDRMMPLIVKQRTIKYDNKLNYYHLTDYSRDEKLGIDKRIVSELSVPTFNFHDTHFSPAGHMYMADIITKELIKLNYGNIPLRAPKLIHQKILDNSLFMDYINHYYNNDKSEEYKQILLYRRSELDDIAFDLDYSNSVFKPDDFREFKLLNEYGLIRIWMLVYPPKKGVDWHSDDSLDFYRYVYEVQVSDGGVFEYMKRDEILTIADIEKNNILYIGDMPHRFTNKSDTQYRISIVFDTELPISELKNNNTLII